jgi:PncC family amidohydrolase
MEAFDLEIIGQVHRFFKSRGLRLAVSESHTLSLLGHMLTALPGASEFFDAALICHSADSMTRLLGIKGSFIEKHGIASEETARAMAEAARQRTGADVALALAGSPGPAEAGGAEVVYMAVCTAKETTSRGFAFEGPSQEAGRAAADQALHFLYEASSVWT